MTPTSLFRAATDAWWTFGPDLAPTPWERAACWAALAATGAANAMVPSLIALFGAVGVATGSVDCGGMALLTALVTSPWHLSRFRVRDLVADWRE